MPCFIQYNCVLFPRLCVRLPSCEKGWRVRPFATLRFLVVCGSSFQQEHISSQGHNKGVRNGFTIRWPVYRGFSQLEVRPQERYLATAIGYKLKEVKSFAFSRVLYLVLCFPESQEWN